MRHLAKRARALGDIAPEERVLAGVVCGALWSLGGLTLATLAVLPGIDESHRGVVVTLAAGAVCWGLLQALAIPWQRAPRWLIHLSVAAGFAIIFGIVASSGGSRSPGWIYLFFVAIFASYFFTPAAAILYLVGCVLTQAAPILYDTRWTHNAYVGELVIAAPAYFAFGATLILGKRLTMKHRTRAELLAGEQSALRRIATAVIEGQEAGAIYALVARESAALLRAGAAGVLRFDGSENATVMGAWSDHPGGNYEPGVIVPVRPGSDVAQARDLHIPVRIDGHPSGSPVANLGYTASIVSPVMIGGRAWGALAVAASRHPPLGPRDEQRLMEFGGLLASAISSIDERATLSAQASTDPLTGLSNRRALQDRLAAEVSRAQRHNRTLAVAVVDIDHFKEFNDYGGHDAGDAMLVQVARCLSDHARAEDTLGRLGGDEFAWIMPETTREQALVAVERVRRLVGATSRRSRLTVSAGICDTRATTHPAELISFADSALYWSKANGRNRSWIYDPELVGQVSVLDAAEGVERSHAVVALRALAQAVDAKDPATRDHSERVAELVAALARNAGWSAEQAMRLREAALMHDVGKVGIPDQVLSKRGPLTDDERRQIREHAELTARIVEGVLRPDQVEWIRAQHERPDGAGYPRGLGEHEIPEGAALLAVADAWDMMVHGRSAGEAKTIDGALRECAELIGQQFTRSAVGALLKLHASGELDHIASPQADEPSRVDSGEDPDPVA